MTSNSPSETYKKRKKPQVWWDFLKHHHECIALFIEHGHVSRKEIWILFIGTLLLCFDVQCIVQLFFLQCEHDNVHIEHCLDSCHDDYGYNSTICQVPKMKEAIILSDYYLYNNSGSEGWNDCWERVQEKIKHKEAELTYTDSCVNYCIDSKQQRRVRNDFLGSVFLGEFVTNTKIDKRPSCDSVSDYDRENLVYCKTDTLQCSHTVKYAVKIAIGVAIILPVSLLMHLIVHLAYRWHEKPTCVRLREKNKCCPCVYFGFSYFLIFILLASFTAVGIWCLVYTIPRYHIVFWHVIVEFLIVFGVEAVLDIFIWTFLFFCCMRRWEKKMNKRSSRKNSKIELHTSQQQVDSEPTKSDTNI